MPVKEIKEFVGISLYAQFACVPGGAGEMGAEILDLEPVFNVYGYEDVGHVRFGTQINTDGHRLFPEIVKDLPLNFWLWTEIQQKAYFNIRSLKII